MPFAIAAIVVVVLSFAISAEAVHYYSVRNQLISARRRRADDETIKTLFEEWTARRGKIYSEIGEKGKRFDVFKDNLKFVEDHNNGNNNCTYRLGLNKFADLTNEEYRAAYLPEFVDWTERRAVGPVKDNWTLGLDAPQTEKALHKASSHQPICVAIEASGRALQLYSSGVFTGDCGAHLDHGVVVVGYGSESKVDYWIVKNSWGTDWGENGYLKLARNVDIPGGKCGIVMGAYYAMKGKKSTNSDIDNGYHKAE